MGKILADIARVVVEIIIIILINGESKKK